MRLRVLLSDSTTNRMLKQEIEDRVSRGMWWEMARCFSFPTNIGTDVHLSS